MTADGREWLRAVGVYARPRVIAIGFLGFASGLPLLLTLSTLSIWLAEEGVTKTAIGLFALVGIPYSLKFLWAPLIDRLPVPLLTRALGRRRGWMILTQVLLMAALLGLGATSPAEMPEVTAICALAVAFCSASQDIVIDAHRVEILEEREYGAGAAMIVFGYRCGLLVAGAGALYIASITSWFWVYAAMAALVLVGVATVLLSPEPEVSVRAAARRGSTGSLRGWLYEAVIAPFADFMQRRGWVAILAFVLLYKFGDALAGVMANPFYIELGFTKVEIANVSKLFGFAATLLGGFAGGILVNRWGIVPSLLVCGVLQLLSNLLFAVQAVVGHDIGMLMVTIGFENLSGGMGTAAFVAYLSSLCNVAYTATQYALLSSLMAVARTVLASPGGWLAEQLSWVTFFALTAVAAVPGLLLLMWITRRFPPPLATAAAR